jgi:hypothetical protein
MKLPRIMVCHNSHFASCDITILKVDQMKTVAASFIPPIALDLRAKAPLYLQLYDWFRGAIIAGQMRPGQRVPATRILAAELKISRIPVLNATTSCWPKATLRPAWERVPASRDRSPMTR